jgi:hypothetical protein
MSTLVPVPELGMTLAEAIPLKLIVGVPQATGEWEQVVSEAGSHETFTAVAVAVPPTQALAGELSVTMRSGSVVEPPIASIVPSTGPSMRNWRGTEPIRIGKG